MNQIFHKIHNMDSSVEAHRHCMYCNRNTPDGSNKLCEQCKREHPEILQYWLDTRRVLRSAKCNSWSIGKTFSLRGQYSLSAEWAQHILRQQQYRCYYFNIPLQFETGSPWTLSPERLDNTLGYTPDNTRLICRIFNTSDNTN
eukprot:79558_1